MWSDFETTDKRLFYVNFSDNLARHDAFYECGESALAGRLRFWPAPSGTGTSESSSSSMTIAANRLDPPRPPTAFTATSLRRAVSRRSAAEAWDNFEVGAFVVTGMQERLLVKDAITKLLPRSEDA